LGEDLWADGWVDTGLPTYRDGAAMNGAQTGGEWGTVLSRMVGRPLIAIVPR
jgi:hypothetical protein